MSKIEIRTYQKGDSGHMARVYNAVMQDSHGFNAESGERLEQIYSGPNFDPASKQIAVIDGQVVGYMTTTPNPSDRHRANVNFPYVLPDGGDDARSALLQAGLAYLRKRGVTDLGTAYFNNAWTAHLAFFETRGFKRRTVRYRVVEGLIPPVGDHTHAGPYTIRSASPDDFTRMCELHQLALGDIPDPAPMQPQDFERFLAAPYATEDSLTVAESAGEIVATMLGYLPTPAAADGSRIGMVNGPTASLAAWSTPAPVGLWSRAVGLLRAGGATRLRSYAPDAGTPETARLLDHYAKHGMTGDDIWVHLHRAME